MDEETKRRFVDHENRIKKLETLLESGREKPKVSNEDYSGISGGIRRLINENFLDSPKTAEEVHKELVRQGYHYPKESVRTALSRDFIPSRLLTRNKMDSKWAYARRK